MALTLRRFMQRSNEEISPLVGLSLGALYLAAVAGIGIAALHVQRTELSNQLVVDGKQIVYWLSRHLAEGCVENDQALSSEVRRAARGENIAFASVVSADGTIIAHSDPTRVGQPAEELEWADTNPAGVRVASPLDRPGESVLAARVISPTGTATTHELRLGLRPARISWGQSTIFFWSGYILLAVLGLYLLVYRLLRRAVEPLAVIRGRLLNCSEPVAEKLVSLRLNDSFDEISASWNHLIEFIGDLQEQLRKSKLTEDVTAAMDGYRSERLTNILMKIPFGVVVVDGERMISFANRAACGMLSKPGESLEGVSAGDILDESLLMSLLAAPPQKRSALAHRSRWTDHTFERPHGEVTLRFWSIAAEGATGEHILFVQDVTQSKEAERARDQFLYHVTHELRTPLTNIRAYAETLSQGVIDDPQTVRECYNVIMSETQRLNRLVEDILNVSQLEVGTARLSATEVAIDQLLRKIVQDTQGSADAKNIDLLLSLPAKLPKVRGDRDRLAVVLTNLVGNAIKYTPADGRVDVRTEEEQGRLRIVVSDTGMGIDQADQEKIFEKFYRVDSDSVSKIPGTGLGLAIVKETVRLHGGSVFVESVPGKGSSFTVVLPAIPVDESARQARPSGAPSQEKP
jgi:two-component system phosphate regulon sensor histidine kinase PhoR